MTGGTGTINQALLNSNCYYTSTNNNNSNNSSGSGNGSSNTNSGFISYTTAPVSLAAESPAIRRVLSTDIGPDLLSSSERASPLSRLSYSLDSSLTIEAASPLRSVSASFAPEALSMSSSFTTYTNGGDSGSNSSAPSLADSPSASLTLAAAAAAAAATGNGSSNGGGSSSGGGNGGLFGSGGMSSVYPLKRKKDDLDFDSSFDSNSLSASFEGSALGQARRMERAAALDSMSAFAVPYRMTSSTTSSNGSTGGGSGGGSMFGSRSASAMAAVSSFGQTQRQGVHANYQQQKYQSMITPDNSSPEDMLMSPDTSKSAGLQHTPPQQQQQQQQQQLQQPASSHFPLGSPLATPGLFRRPSRVDPSMVSDAASGLQSVSAAWASVSPHATSTAVEMLMSPADNNASGRGGSNAMQLPFHQQLARCRSISNGGNGSDSLAARSTASSVSTPSNSRSDHMSFISPTAPKIAFESPVGNRDSSAMQISPMPSQRSSANDGGIAGVDGLPMTGVDMPLQFTGNSSASSMAFGMTAPSSQIAPSISAPEPAPGAGVAAAALSRVSVPINRRLQVAESSGQRPRQRRLPGAAAHNQHSHLSRPASNIMDISPCRPQKIRRSHTAAVPSSSSSASVSSGYMITESPNTAALRECQALPVHTVGRDNLKRITGATLAALINGVYNHRYVIADCRFDYEFKAGHIAGAVHVGSHDDIETLFFNDPLAVMDGDSGGGVGGSGDADGEEAQPVVLVVHCEYSMIRGPTRAQQIRALDRQLHADRYPYLRYTEVYVLDGGFVNFYKSYRGLCDGEYRAMEPNDPRMNEFKRPRAPASSSVSGMGELVRSASHIGAIGMPRRGSMPETSFIAPSMSVSDATANRNNVEDAGGNNRRRADANGRPIIPTHRVAMNGSPSTTANAVAAAGANGATATGMLSRGRSILTSPTSSINVNRPERLSRRAASSMTGYTRPDDI